jgi:hypothetical protein
LIASVPYAKFGDPQTLNLYTYVENSPLNRIDADGHQDGVVPCSGTQAACNTSSGGQATPMKVADYQAPAQNASTMPLAPPAPIVLPAIGEAIKDLVGGIIETLAVPVIAATYLVSPGAQVDQKELDYQKGNTNPYAGPVSAPVTVVDPKGNAVPVKPGEQIQGSKDGRWAQVKDANGQPTGTRIDGGHPASTHSDPRAQVPHAHVPGVKNADGTPWLPVNQ